MFLIELLYILIWCLGIFFVVRLMQKPGLIYYYPYLMSFGFTIFILPQVLIIYEKNLFAADGTTRVFLMTLLCWTMAFLGWYSYKPQTLIFKKFFVGTYDDDKLGFAGAAFIAIGIAMNFMASSIFRTSEFQGQQATGVVTIFAFFQQLLFLGTGLCLTLYLKNKKNFVLVFTVIGILYCFYIGVLQGRRQQTLNALFVLGIPLYLHRRLQPPRILIVFALVSTFLLVPSTHEYRRILKSSENVGVFFQRMFTEIDYVKNMKSFYLNSSESIELVNAAYEINTTYESGAYKLGFDYWNMLVFQLIPAQLIGKEFKESIMIKKSLFISSDRYFKPKYNPKYVLGTTVTGIGDAFSQFDYFGCLFFLFLGMFMKRVWYSCKETGSPLLESFYSIVLIECLISLTHGTAFFFPGLVKAFAFLMLAGLYAQKRLG